MKIVVLDGYTENPGDISWVRSKLLARLPYMTELLMRSPR